MMNRFVQGLALAVLGGQPCFAVPVINNAGFTQGATGLDGWTLQGYGDTAPPNGFGTLAINPGTNAATLYTNDGPYPGGTTPSPLAITQAQAESSLGLSAGALQAVSDNSGPMTTGSILFQAITGLTGDQITFATDYANQFGDSSGNDFAFAVLSDPTGAVADLVIRTGSGLPGLGLPPTQFTFLRDATLANPLILGFGIFNTSDDFEATNVRFANIVGIAAAPSAEAPEIDRSTATAPLAACVLTLLTFGARRRREALA